MINFLKIIKKYTNHYLHFFIFHFKSRLSYRTNIIMLFLYGPSYVFVLYGIMQLIYLQTPQLLGWNKSEALILFVTFHLVYSICIILFIDGLRKFLWEDIRIGTLDTYLTKPVNPQFIIAFSRPGLDQSTLVLALMIILGLLLHSNRESIAILQLIAYIFSIFLAISTVYLTLSTYATLGFYMTKAGQIMELFDKSCDFAQYPPQIFPKIMQVLTITVIPIAMFSYIPSSILLGKMPVVSVVLMIFFVIILGIINSFCWRISLKRYTSASS